MALPIPYYLDKRFLVNGQLSQLGLENFLDLTDYITRIVNTLVPGGGTPGAYTFENGLQMIPTDKVQLGGSLIQHTNIDGDASTGFGGLHQLWFTNLNTFYTQANSSGGLPYVGDSYQLALNKSASLSFPINGVDSASLTYNDVAGYGAGFLLTTDGFGPRPYIVSEMSYGGGVARTAKIEFSNDYILNSHKIYDVANPSGMYKEYAIRYGDSQLSMYSINTDTSNPLDLTSNITNDIVVSSNGITFDSYSSTGSPTFNYTFPITSLTKPAPDPGHSMVLNSTGTHFDFVKDYKSLYHCFFNVSETVVIKTVKIPVMFDKYILESITVCEPNGGGTITLKITKGFQNQSIVVNANNGVTNYLLNSITNLIAAPEFVSIELNSPSNPAMTQLSVTLNFLYAG